MKLALRELDITEDVGALLRLVGENVFDLSHDWATQFEDGATDYA